MDYLTLEFYGTLSASHGETSGNNDEKIIFKNATTAEPKSEVSFEIPFEYKNENSPVKVEKSSTFSPVNQSIDYTVKVYTPKSNTLTSESVKLTDAFDSTAYLVNVNSNANGVYQNVKATLYTNTNNGTSLTNGTDITSKFTMNRSSNGVLDIGDMAPDSMVVLTYTVKVANDYFSTTSAPKIVNVAQATYNDTSSDPAVREEECSGMAKITKAAGSIVTEDNGDSYIPYTVTVTAHGQVTNITVKDNFTQGVNAIKELKNITTSQGSAQDDSNKNLVWDVGTLSDGQTATMTYRAYLDLDAWEVSSGVSSGSPVEKDVYITNQADLYVGSDLLGSVSVTKKITKTWVKKIGTKDNSGNLSYTVYVNSDPVATDITSIYDNLDSTSANAGATIGYPVNVTVYKSSTNLTQVKSFSLSSSTTGFTAGATGWKLDLTTYDNGSLNGKGYYYVITYTAKGGSAKDVVNGAGLNRGDIGYGEETTIQVKTVKSHKEWTDVAYREGYVSWKTTMETDIDAGSVYTDYIDDDKVGAGFWWYTMDDINAIEVYQGDTLIYSQAKGINLYDISVDVWDYKAAYANNPYGRQPVNIPYWTYTTSANGSITWSNNEKVYGKTGYFGFKVTFGKAIQVEGKSNVYIKYNCSASWENMYHYSMTNYRNYTNVVKGNANYYVIETRNKGQWMLGSGVKSDEFYSALNMYSTNDVVKGSTYDASTGIITWKIYINRQGDMIGDATVEDILPEGLEYIEGSATLSYTTSDGTTYVDSEFNTSNRNGSNGNIKQVDGKDAVTVENLASGETKITVLLENLKGFSYNTYTQNENGTYSLTKSGSYDSDWWKDGNVVLTIQTRVDDDLLLKGAAQSFTNVATVTNDTMAGGSATAYATQALNTTPETVLKKTMDNYTSGTVLTFNLDINSEGGNLVYNSDTLEIMDVMNSKMSLATHRDNYFVVTEVDKDGNVLSTLSKADSAEITADQYYLEQVGEGEYKIIVPDGKRLHIQYLVMVNAAIGEKVDISNTAYFVYEGLKPADTQKVTAENITISKAKGGSGASADGPSFKIFKEDQWGNAVEGVTFALYEVQLDNTGAAIYENGQVKLSNDPVATKTTDSSGYVGFTGLDEDGVYCFVETSAPTGYMVNASPTYFYFTYKENLNLDGAIGIDYNEKVFDVVNTFNAASLNVSLIKTINGEDQESTNQFKFTLAKTSDTTGAMYSDEDCINAVDSVEAAINGSGTVKFDTVYFKELGVYKFTLSENDLTEDETKEGFTKDNTVYNIEAKVVNGNNGLYLEYAKYTWTDADGEHTGNLLGEDVPTFNNTLKLDPVTVKLEATKKLTSTSSEVTERSYDIKEGEFTFKVVENGEVIATGKTKAGSATQADIVFTSEVNGETVESIEFNQNQLGTHVLTIYEVEGTDFTIDYSTVKFFATVVVEPVKGEAKLTATVTYSTQDKSNLDVNGKPVFTNSYTPIIPTGIPTEFVPFAMMAVMAGSIGAVVMVRRWKRRLAGK
jgi:hypothetical protein